MKKLVTILCILLSCVMLLCSCESGVIGAMVDEDGHLILTLEDGSTLDAGDVSGEQGAKGAQGIQGYPGEKGDTGAQGPKGDTGAQGEKGDTGATGAQGPKGDTGAQGPQGEKGDKGDDGITPQIRINAFTYEWEISADNGATWTSTGIKATGLGGGEGGTSSRVRINAETNEWELSVDGGVTWTSTGVKATGDKGEKGDTGAQGEKGDTGATGAQGEKGEDGVTPQLRINATTNEWEVSTDNGVTWTSTGVKATGEKGEQGEAGAQGPQGEKGEQGEKGDTGAKGDKGDTGATGATGATIQKVEFDAQGRIVITLTNGTVLPAVEIPEKHTYGDWVLCGDAHTYCEERIYYRVCEDCDVTEWRHGKEADHVWKNGKCEKCGKDALYTRDGNTIYFGTYPQSEVTEVTLISTLNAKAGTLPTSSNSYNWTSYGYYISGSVQNYMWYIDVTEGSEKYRGVYFTSYRPYWTTDSSTTDNTYQDDNGYSTGAIYWFQYEPIAWTILKETDGTALLLCDMIIDSQAYQNEYAHDSSTGEYYNTSSGVPSGTYANNYEYSTIRKWLNDTFYETAFNEYQQAIILTTTVDNSAASTDYSSNPYACEDTNDKVFLLSHKEAVTAEYGFTTDINSTTTREKQTTAYAQVQGARTYTSTDYAGNGVWWIRSPSCGSSKSARIVFRCGNLSNPGSVYSSSEGVVPALQIRL